MCVGATSAGTWTGMLTIAGEESAARGENCTLNVDLVGEGGWGIAGDCGTYVGGTSDAENMAGTAKGEATMGGEDTCTREGGNGKDEGAGAGATNTSCLDEGAGGDRGAV